MCLYLTYFKIFFIGGYGGGGGGVGGGNFAYARDVDSYKVYPGSLSNGEEQAQGTPASDNYRTDRTPSVVSEKRTVDQVTPHNAPAAVNGSANIAGSKRGNLATVTGSNDTIEELTIDDDIKDDLTLEENKDIVKKIYFNNLIHEHHGGEADDKDDEDNDEEARKTPDDGDESITKSLKDGISSGDGGSGGDEEGSKRKVVKSPGNEEISGYGSLNTHLIGPEAGITRVFVEPMVVKREYVDNSKKNNANDNNVRMSYFAPKVADNEVISSKSSTGNEPAIRTDKKSSLLLKIELFKRKFFSDVAP